MISIITEQPLNNRTIQSQTSTVGEPSLGVSSSRIFYTGNWYAAESNNNGSSWNYISPVNYLKPPSSGGFCCDQTVIYDPINDVIIWILQYAKNNNENVLRIAVKGGNQDNSSNPWHWWDITPTVVDPTWNNEWFDYNHASVSSNFLYIGTNVFGTQGQGWTRSVILRFPLSNIASGQNLGFDFFDTNQNFSLRCVQGADNVMYFGSHNSNAEIRVFSWPEQPGSSITSDDISITRWSLPGATGYSSICPDGTDWLKRCDSRITGAWVSQNEVGFLWTANKNMNLERSQPHIRAVTLDRQTMQLVDEPDIWHKDYAYAYPNSSTNSANDLGIAMFRGGGAYYPSIIVGSFDNTNSWDLRVVKEGTNGPLSSKWGDYVTCRSHFDGQSWVASGFTLEGGGSQSNILPRYIHFAHINNSKQKQSIV